MKIKCKKLFIFGVIFFSLFFINKFLAYLFETPCEIDQIFKRDYSNQYLSKMKFFKKNGKTMIDLTYLANDFNRVCLTSRQGRGYDAYSVWGNSKYLPKFSPNSTPIHVGKRACWGSSARYITIFAQLDKKKVLTLKLNLDVMTTKMSFETDYHQAKAFDPEFTQCISADRAVATCIETGQNKCMFLFNNK